jgi:hypothetical protein
MKLKLVCIAQDIKLNNDCKRYNEYKSSNIDKSNSTNFDVNKFGEEKLYFVFERTKPWSYYKEKNEGLYQEYLASKENQDPANKKAVTASKDINKNSHLGKRNF